MFHSVVAFVLAAHLVHGIYVPTSNATGRGLSHVGIKTLGWQSSLGHAPGVTVHHNYSRVYTHQPQSNGHSYNRSYTHEQGNGAPKTGSNLTQIADQHSQIFENYQESSNYHQGINDQLGEFHHDYTHRPQSYGYSYNRSYTREQSNRTPKTGSNFTQIGDQHPQVHHQQFSDYRQGINDQLGEFSSYHQDLVQNVNENLQNQHGGLAREGNYLPPSTGLRDLRKIVKPKTSVDIHLNPQEMKFVEEEFQVHKVCPSGATGQFVTELSCNQFLNCWRGRGFVQNCAPGTLFNPKTLECDFQDKVTCITGPREVALNEREPLSEALQARCPQGFSGIIPHYTDCSKFINCDNGAEFVMDCAPGTLFDIKSNTCDYPHKALCVGNENIEWGYGGGQSSSNKLVTIQGYKSNITYQIPAQNINDQLQELRTYGNSYGGRGGRDYLVDNQQSQYNQWQGQTPIYIGNLSSTFKIIPSNQDQPQQQKPPQPNQREPKCPDGQSGLFPHPTICTKFLNCDHGRTFIQDCGPGTAFNPQLKVCDYPYNVGCQAEDDLDEDAYTTESYDENIYANGNYKMVAGLNQEYSMGLNQNYCRNKPKGFLIYPKDCSRFLYCDDDGKLFIGVCSENMYFNPAKGDCEENVNCLTIFNQYSGGYYLGFENWQANTQYQDFRLLDITIGYDAYILGLDKRFCEVNPGFSIHPKNCSRFLLCVSPTRLLLGICNLNTYFNPSTRTCDGTYNCGQIQREHQPDGSGQQSGVIGQENWQPNTQYQHFRLASIGYEANILGLNKGFCQINPGFSIHPKDCAKFLLCTPQGQILLGICNPNTYYNPLTRTCESTYNCGHIQHGNQSGDSGHQIGITGQENWQPNIQYQQFRLASIGYEADSLGLNKGFCQINPGFSIHPKDCAKFLLCTSQGQILLGICNPNTYYNPLTRTCESTYTCGHIRRENQFGGGEQQSGSSVQENWQTNTQYQHFKLTNITGEAHRLRLNRYYCQNNPGFSVHPTDCSKFLLCTPDRLLLGICNPNTFYNPSTRTCDSSSTCQHIRQPEIPSGDNQQWKVNQQYDDFYLREAGNEMIMLKMNMFYCLNNDGFSAHPKNCSRFFLCQNGRLMLGVCKPQRYFNPSTKRCDGNYECAHGQGGQDNLESSRQQSPQWENQQFSLYAAKHEMESLNLDANYCKTHDGFSEYPGNCTRFLYCKYGRLYIGHCKPNMVYNQTLKTCDYNSRCRKIEYERVQESDVSCKSKPNGFHPHPTICSKFVNCERGLAKIHDCAAGTVFNPKLKLCDSPRNVNCKDGGGNRWEGQDYQYHQNSTNDQWAGQLHQNQWEDQYNQKRNQDNQWKQTQDNQWSRWDQNSQWLTTQRPSSPSVIDEDEDNNFVTYDQNKKPTNKWPPPFPTTDPNADYVFEANDLMEVTVPDKVLKDTCEDTDFKCTKTTCIEPSRVCDGSLDCPDGEDEKNCEKFIEEFQHISSTKMAVKERIKYANITLTLCAKNCIESKGFICKAFNFRKMDGACFLLTTNVGLSGSLFILPTYDYYEYKKYSIDCSKMYKCTNQKCIEEHQICDGVSDCVDRYDEKGCTAQELGYSVKLVGTGKSYEGAVQVTALGKTGYVCDDMFSLPAADILCKELGFQLGAVAVKGNSYFAQNLTKNETFFIMDDVVCNGDEVSIRDCDFSGWGVSNCMEKEVLGVICETPEESCAAEMWKCVGVAECIPVTFLCDGVADCRDVSDELDSLCQARLEMRLVGGKTDTEGRVEIKYHGTWGTICDDDLNDDAAKVICAYFGYPGPARIVKEGYFGQGTGPIWLDQVFCHGNETSLEDCIRWDWGVHNCDHTEDAGVICRNYNNEEIPRRSRIEDDEPTTVLAPDRCGYRNDDIFLDNSDVNFRVVASSLAGRGQYPWQASLRVKTRTSTNHWCGAVVISAKFVLTAAHCLHGFTKGAYVVVAGDYDANDDEGTEQQVYIDEFYIHEDFRKGTKMNNDIALIRLKGNGFNITKDVQPICLPDADFINEAGLNCTISGFGSVQTGKAVASKELRAGWIPIQPSEVCKMPHIYGKTITDGMICAGYLEGGIDACDGDSGGPLACLYNGLFTLVGITSWGQHCGEANKPGVYVKIAHYRNWIDETMKKHA